MKLYSVEFYRGLRGRVKREVKTRPEWRKAAREARGPQRQYSLTVFRWVVPLMLGTLALAQPSGPMLWLVFILWSLVMACFRAGQVQALAAGREGVTAFVQLPVSDGDVFHYIRSRVLRTSYWVFFDALAVFSALCFAAQARPASWLAVLPAAALLWAAVLALATVLLQLRPSTNLTWLGSLLLWGAYIGGFILRASKPDTLTPERMEVMATVVSWVTPPGWVTQIAGWIVRGNGPFPLSALSLLALFFAGTVPCYRALAARFVFWESEPPPFAPAEQDDELTPEPPRESRASEVGERIETRAFLVALDGHRRGWIERLIFSALRRHATTLDFLVGLMPAWSALFRKGVVVLLAAPLVAWLGTRWSETTGTWLLAGGVCMALACTTPILGGAWEGFGLGTMGHRYIALLALLPVSLREIRRVVLAVNALRFLLALPCWLAAGWLISRASGEAPLTGLRWASESWLALLLLQPFFLVFAFSRGTNDTTSGCLMKLVIFAGGILTLAACVLALVAIYLNAAWRWQVAALLALGICSFAFEAIYRWLYHGQRFDLMAKSHGLQ